MSLPERRPRDIDLDARTRLIEDLRARAILRSSDEFRLKKSDLDASTNSWKFVVFARSAAIGFGLWLVVGAVMWFFNIHYTVQDRVAPILFAVLVLVIPGLLAWGAYVTHPWAVWGIATLGSLRSVKGGRIIVLPFLKSAKGVLKTPENTFYVPVNQGIMRGLAGQSTIRVSLNVTVTYAAKKSQKARFALFLNVSEPDISLFRIAETAITGWMREHPFTALLETATLAQTVEAVKQVIREKFPRQSDAWYEAFIKEVLSVVYTPQDLERLKRVEVQASPGEKIKDMLQREVENWGLEVTKVGLSDIELPEAIAAEFERAEAIREQVANISHALRTEFPGQDPAWYRDVVVDRLTDLIRFGGGRPPQVFTRLDDSGETPFGR